ncbi:unnamed protein product [Ilex paraguariensis]|uniref:Uncharacterized protein n=1 Tax=Ilex paraguariensis TaxID=185542 RepID=A0ABC8U045_9AQUA
MPEDSNQKYLLSSSRVLMKRESDSIRFVSIEERNILILISMVHLIGSLLWEFSNPPPYSFDANRIQYPFSSYSFNANCIQYLHPQYFTHSDTKRKVFYPFNSYIIYPQNPQYTSGFFCFQSLKFLLIQLTHLGL